MSIEVWIQPIEYSSLLCQFYLQMFEYFFFCQYSPYGNIPQHRAGLSTNLRITMLLHCYSTTSFMQRSGDSDAESLLVLSSFMPLATYFVSVIPSCFLQLILFLLCPCNILQTSCRNVIGVFFNSN
jgi:hypothetical protein